MDIEAGVGLLKRYFPNLTDTQIEQYTALGRLYVGWNEQINLISRKDIIHLYPRHILHSLGIAKVVTLQAGATILDVGTGGGFPGIPLAIFFPAVHFTLVDSIGKKIKAVTDMVAKLGLKNVTPIWGRAEEVTGRYDFVVSRATAKLSTLYGWVQGKIKPKDHHAIPNGVLYLKGGDLKGVLQDLTMAAHVYDLAPLFPIPFFESKKLVHLYPANRSKRGH